MSASRDKTSARLLLEESGLASSHEPVDVTLVSALLEQHYRVRGHLERLATEKDDTFRLSSDSGCFLVKVSPPDEPAAVVAMQTAAMRFLEAAAADLPVQRVVPTADGDDHLPVQDGDRARLLRVFGYVEGAVLAGIRPDAAQLAKAGAMLGRVDVALQAFTHPADRRRLAWDIRHFHELGELVEHTPDSTHRGLARRVARLFCQTVVPRMSSLETQVIHGDYSPHNVVVDPQSDEFVTGIIDFGDAVRSALIFDPAVCMANLLGRTPGHPWRDAGNFLTGYVSTRPVKERELPLLPIAALARLTLRALITNWRAQHVPERRDYLLDHAQHDWLNIEHALAAPSDDVFSGLRGGPP